MLRENYNGQTVEDRQKERDTEHFVTVLFEEKDKKAAEGDGQEGMKLVNLNYERWPRIRNHLGSPDSRVVDRTGLCLTT